MNSGLEGLVWSHRYLEEYKNDKGDVDGNVYINNLESC